MSDAYGSFGNPYGVPPPFPNQPPTGPPPSGPPDMPPGPPRPPVTPPVRAAADRRPGVVTAGAVVAIVLTVMMLLVLLLIGLGMVAEYIDPDPGDAISTDGLVGGLIALGFFAALNVFAIVLAGLVLARRQWARVTLIVFGFVSFPMLLPIITSVLLLLPSAGRWYAGRSRTTPGI